MIMGFYDCERKTITIFLGCLPALPCKGLWAFTEVLGETLAHELVHHSQFTGASVLGLSSTVRYRGCNDPSYKTARNYPYRYRPYEAEAFDKMSNWWYTIAGNKNILSAVRDAARVVCNYCRCC